MINFKISKSDVNYFIFCFLIVLIGIGIGFSGIVFHQTWLYIIAKFIVVFTIFFGFMGAFYPLGVLFNAFLFQIVSFIKKIK
jgi:hypothetical protein